MVATETTAEVEEDISNDLIHKQARFKGSRWPYGTDLLADEILGAFLHSLDPADLSLLTGRSKTMLSSHPAMPELLQKHKAVFLHAASDVLFNRYGLKCAQLPILVLSTS